MALLTVTVNGSKFVVDASNKGTAKAFGRKQIEVDVAEATADDVTNFLASGGKIEKLEAAAVAAPAAVEGEAGAPEAEVAA